MIYSPLLRKCVSQCIVLCCSALPCVVESCSASMWLHAFKTIQHVCHTSANESRLHENFLCIQRVSNPCTHLVSDDDWVICLIRDNKRAIRCRYSWSDDEWVISCHTRENRWSIRCWYSLCDDGWIGSVSFVTTHEPFVLGTRYPTTDKWLNVLFVTTNEPFVVSTRYPMTNSLSHSWHQINRCLRVLVIRWRKRDSLSDSWQQMSLSLSVLVIRWQMSPSSNIISSFVTINHMSSFVTKDEMSSFATR